MQALGVVAFSKKVRVRSPNSHQPGKWVARTCWLNKDSGNHMHPIFLYCLGILFAWGLLEFLTRSGLMASSNGALMLALGVMLIIVSVADWQMNSPMINARTGDHVTLDDYIEINGIVVVFSFLVSIILEVRKRQSGKEEKM